MKVVQKFVFCFGLILFLSPLCNSQQKIRIVEKGLSFPNQPIEVVSKELDGKPLSDNKGVLGNQDWLKHLTLSVKNVSNKNIMSFDIDLLIKKQGNILMGIPIYFRTFFIPDYTDALTPSGEKKTGFLLPGEVVKVKVSDRIMQIYGKELVKHEVEDIDRVTIEIRGVYFDDHSRWMFGQESRPDPNNPEKRLRIDKPESKVLQRFSEWLEDLLPTDWTYSRNPFAFMFPAFGRNFFTSANAKFVLPASGPDCIWFVEDELTTPPVPHLPQLMVVRGTISTASLRTLITQCIPRTQVAEQ